MGEDIGEGQRSELATLLDMHRDCFSFGSSDMGVYKGSPFRIDLKDESIRLFKRQYPLSQMEKSVISKKVEDLLKNGLIRKSESLHGFASPTVLPPKKNELGEIVDWRMCGDYRELNLITLTDPYPLPTPEEIFDCLGGARYFSILDLRQGFHQIPIEPTHCHRTAFWGGSDLYEWIYMPFGVKNAPAKFQRVMDEVLKGIHFARCYIDDVIIFSTSFEDHLKHVGEVLRTLRKAGLKCHPGKSTFAVQEVLYLGHWIKPNTLMPFAAKVEAIDKMPPPTNVSELRTFLGLASYYRKFIPNFSTKAYPLNQLLRNDVPWAWGERETAAMSALKSALKSEPILRMPDHSLPFILYTDWSQRGLGAVLAQKEKETNEEFVVAYASRSNNRSEGNYSSYHGELLAVVWAVQHFRPYLYGVHFSLVTDHQPLSWIMKTDKLTGKLARWTCILQEYDFTVVHRPGADNSNADALSRNPLTTVADLTSARMDNDSSLPAAFVFATMAAKVISNTLVNDEAMESEAPIGGGRKDIWNDIEVINFIQTGVLPEDLGSQRRIQSRAATYSFYKGRLIHHFPDGTQKVVPDVPERLPLIRNLHRRCGHYGQKRTLSLLSHMYWWPGMSLDVKEAVRSCEICDVVKSGLVHSEPSKLQSLPIMGMFYRWSLDLAGPLPISKRGNRFVLVMIEHFSKWIELVVLPRKESSLVADAFLQRVLTLYGAPAEVLTDQGTEFAGQFQSLCDVALIDHRRTSRDHPQADGLAERMVQTVKFSLRKYALEISKSKWDDQVPWIAMGYRFSAHASLGGLSPYELLFGRKPPLPGSAIVAHDEQLSETAVRDMILQRAEEFKRLMPHAMGNLRIAQHRDQMWYSRKRSGEFQPRVHRFQPGDFVYVSHQTKDTLDVVPTRRILQVVKDHGNGVLSLKGPNPREEEISEHVQNCSPCHLPELYSHPELYLTYVPEEALCVICSKTDPDQALVVCGVCHAAYHHGCLPSTFPRVSSHWQCLACSEP